MLCSRLFFAQLPRISISGIHKLIFAILAFLVGPIALATESWAPSKPVRLVVPFSAGSATDQLARAIGAAVQQKIGQPVIVDNRPGANGIIGAEYVAKSAPDGYTILIGTNTTNAANQHLYRKLPYDPIKDFTPISALGRGGQILVVHPAVHAETLGEFIALAKANPGKMTYGSGSASSHVAAEKLLHMADIRLLHVPYKSNPPAISDLLAGQINMMVTDMATGLPLVKSGKLRALGVSSRTRSPLLPNVPTIAEAGVPGYEATYWFAAFAPAGTPANIVAGLGKLVRDAAQSSAASAFYKSTGTEIFTTNPEELAQFTTQESAKWKAAIQTAGIQPE